MELRVLRYFLAVAREGNITNAANILHLTQPTLSRQIKELEEELEQQLLIRKSHRVELTAEGMLLRKRAEEILAMVDKTESEFKSMKHTISGDIYIGGGETDAIKLVAEVMKDLSSTHPDVHYHLYSGNAADVTERLDKGLLDFGILIQPADISKYNYINLPTSDTWGVIMRKDCHLATQQFVFKEDLLHLPLLLSRQAITQKQSENEFIQWFGEDFDKLNIVTTFNLLYNASVLVESGLGYAIAIDKLINNENLCFRPLAPQLQSGLNIIWKKNQIFSKAAELFLETLNTKFNKQIR